MLEARKNCRDISGREGCRAHGTSTKTNLMFCFLFQSFTFVRACNKTPARRAHQAATYFAGTRDFSSLIQLTTTVMVGSGADVEAPAVSLSIKNRWPSADISYERRS